MLKINFKKLIFLILITACVAGVLGCVRREAAKPVVNNNQNVNEGGDINDVEEIEVWPDVSFSEEDYKGWKTYTNTDLGYSIKYPVDWTVEEYGEVAINPSAHEPYSFYIHLVVEERELETVRNLKKQYNYTETRITFMGQKAYQFVPNGKENFRYIYIPYKNTIYRVSTDHPQNKLVQQALASFKFID